MTRQVTAGLRVALALGVAAVAILRSPLSGETSWFEPVSDADSLGR
jgi:hypothetical protein